MELAAPIKHLNSKEYTDELVEKNIKLVWACMKKYFRVDYGIEYPHGGDIYGSGCEGLVKAAQRFDDTLGIAFSTYAYAMISGDIRRFKRDKDFIIRLPRRIYQLRAEYFKILAENQNISEKEICEKMGIESFELCEIISLSNIDYLDREINTDSDSGDRNVALAERVADEHDCFNEAIDSLDTSSKISILKNLLTHKENLVLNNMIKYQGDITQLQLGMLTNISQVQVSRIQKEITSKYEFVEKVHNGEITIEEAIEQAKQDKKYRSKNERERKKGGAIVMSKSVSSRMDKYVSVLSEWMILNPGKELNVTKVLRDAGLEATGQTTRVKEAVENSFSDRGILLERVLHKNGYGIMIPARGGNKTSNNTLKSSPGIGSCTISNAKYSSATKDEEIVAEESAPTEDENITKELPSREFTSDGNSEEENEESTLDNEVMESLMSLSKEEIYLMAKHIGVVKDVLKNIESEETPHTVNTSDNSIKEDEPISLSNQYPVLQVCKTPVKYLQLSDMNLDKESGYVIKNIIESVFDFLVKNNKKANITVSITEDNNV